MHPFKATDDSACIIPCLQELATFSPNPLERLWRQNSTLFNLKELAFGSSLSCIPATRDAF